MACIADVIERWAEHNEGVRTTRKGRLTSTSVVFDGPVLFSYRMPIAQYHGNMVLFVAGRLRPTNAKHRNWAWHKPTLPNFEVPYIHGNHDRNFLFLLDKLTLAKELYAKRYLRRPESWDYEGMRNEIVGCHTNCVEYQQCTKVEGTVPDLDALMKEADDRREAKWAVYNDPVKVRQRERSAARREAKAALFNEDQYGRY
jgi:hypothetical protein